MQPIQNLVLGIDKTMVVGLKWSDIMTKGRRDYNGNSKVTDEGAKIIKKASGNDIRIDFRF